MTKKFQVELTDRAKKDLKKMDPQMRKILLSWVLKHLQDTEDPRKQGKPLTGQFSGMWRYRVGNYRILAEIQDENIVILLLHIEHRSRVYK